MRGKTIIHGKAVNAAEKGHPFVVKLRFLTKINTNKGILYEYVNNLIPESNRQIKINFDEGDLSSDAGLLLIK